MAAEVFGKIFFILSTGLFLALFMLLIEHPKRKLIGGSLFIFITLTILFSGPELFITGLSSVPPLLIFLDLKRLSWKTCFAFFLGFLGIILLFSFVLIHFIPFYCYPILIFAYVLIAKRLPIKTTSLSKEIS